MRNIQEYKETVNSSVYNKLRKLYLEQSKGLISCSHCKYHLGENDRDKYYGGSIQRKFDTYGYDLINEVEISRDEARANITQYNYGVKWEWRKRYTHTVYTDKKPNWKLIGKAKKQWGKPKLKREDLSKQRLHSNYTSLYSYKW